MKQVTIAGVKDFINEIEKGGLSLREEYVLACLRELVAVTEQRDALVGENAVLIDLARKFADRADDYKSAMMGFNVSESLEELKSAGSKEATDAAIAALRAEGVEMLAERRKKAADIARQRDDLCIADSLEGEAIRAQMFANELRESKGEVQS